MSATDGLRLTFRLYNASGDRYLDIADGPRAQSMTRHEVSETRIRFRALDGYELSGTILAPKSESPPATVALFSCGGGVPAARYVRLGRYLAGQGYPVLTYDYRGIGESRPARLRGLQAGNEDWSEYDCGGAIEEIGKLYPGAERVALAHSFGTYLIGGAPNANEISRFVFIGAHTGYFGDYRRRYRLPMFAIWHGFMPLVTRAVGYFPGKALRLGGDIPRQAALQWATRRTPEFRLENSSDMSRARAWVARHAAVTGEALVVEVADDAFATESGGRRLLNMYPGLTITYQRVEPADVGLNRLGHFGFFRREAESTLWPRLIDFLQRKSLFSNLR